MTIESKLLGFCLKDLVKNTIFCLKSHIINGNVSCAFDCYSFFCHINNHADENINPFFAIRPIHLK